MPIERLLVNGGYLASLPIPKSGILEFGIPVEQIPKGDPSIKFNLSHIQSIQSDLRDAENKVEILQETYFFNSDGLHQLPRLVEVEKKRITEHQFRIVNDHKLGDIQYLRGADEKGTYVHYLQGANGGALSSLEVRCKCEKLDLTATANSMRASLARFEVFQREKTVK